MKRGAIAKPIPIGAPIPLVAADLERLRQPRFVASSPAKLRDSHHRIARLAAAGLRTREIAARAGYSYQRVSDLLGSPAMDELVAQYRVKVDEAFVESQDEFYDLATRNMLAAERHIADHIAELDESGDLLPVRTALAISRDAADRFGYSKHQVNVNVNADFASKLEQAIARSGKGTLIEGTQSLSSSQPHGQALALPQSVGSTSPTWVAQPTPIRRRA